MKKLLVLVVVLILVGAASWAQARFGTGQWLHDNWLITQKANNSTATLTEYRYAYEYEGFVVGASQVMRDARWIDYSTKSGSLGQMEAVVGKYLDDHPEQWNLPAEVLVYRALYAVWPGKVAAPYQ